MRYEGFDHYETREIMRDLGLRGMGIDLIEDAWKDYWQGSKNENGTPTEKAERMMEVLYAFQLQRFIDLLPWDEEDKMPLGSTKLCVEKFFSFDDPKVLNDENVMAEIESFPTIVYAFNIPTPDQVKALVTGSDELTVILTARVF
ncbi:MAG: hypothetical protein IKS39_01160 [Clostridia bacterium]|nr:hypothetical protein [Clostridia bacterium]